jgi:hypothetical protein
MLTVQFKEWKCKVEFAKYPNGITAILLNDAEDGEPVATASANLPEWADQLGEDQTFLKTYSGNEGLLEVLVDAGIIELTYFDVNSNGMNFPACEILKRE